MANETIRIFPLGDTALTVEFGTVISEQLNQKAIAFADHIEKLNFPGLVETVPAYASTTVFFDLMTVKKSFSEFPTAFDAVRSFAEKALSAVETVDAGKQRLVELPVSFDPADALDIDVVAEHNGISANEVIDIFTSKIYRVFMLGFLPGFTYMGELDERIATPRKETPRTLIPKGSVGIAGRQTGIYSLESPGGWQIIGRTDTQLFLPNAEKPSLLQPGDAVKFVRVK